MLEWLQNIANSVFSGLNSLRDWIIRAIAAVYSYISARVGALAGEFASFVYWAERAIGSLGDYARRVYDYAVYIGEHVIRDILDWISRRLTDLDNFVNWMLRELRIGLDNLVHTIETVEFNIVHWVVANIYQPIKDFIDGIVRWFTDNINNILKYFLHPELLARLIAEWVWREWINLIRQYSRPVAKWLFGHMISLAVLSANVIEDVLTAII